MNFDLSSIGPITNIGAISSGISHLFAIGGPVMWALLAVCLLQWYLITERFWFIRLAYPLLSAQKIHEWHTREDQRSWRAQAVRQAMVCDMRLALNAWLSTLRTLIAICPLLGLLGTVTGMINVFEILTLTGGDSRALANGIYRATIPTMSGLVISLSGQYFSSRLRHLAEREQQQFADALTHH